MLFISLNQTGILLIPVQDGLYLSLSLSGWESHQELYSWAVNRQKKFLVDGLFHRQASSQHKGSSWESSIIRGQTFCKLRLAFGSTKPLHSVMKSRCFCQTFRPGWAWGYVLGMSEWSDCCDLCFVPAHGWLSCQLPWSGRGCKARRKEQKNQEKRGAMELKPGRKGQHAGYSYPGFGYQSIPIHNLHHPVHGQMHYRKHW